MRIETMKELITKLNEASELYYNGKETIMTDKEWDSMYDKLLKLENETGVVFNNSPSQTVGYEIKNNLAKVEHTKPMLSLNKTKDVEN